MAQKSWALAPEECFSHRINLFKRILKLSDFVHSFGGFVDAMDTNCFSDHLVRVAAHGRRPDK
jgi:hypothetical protein